MKPAAAAILSCLIYAAPSYGADPLATVPKDQRTGYRQIREANLRTDVGFLASDALMGRMSLETGNDVAIQWIAAEFLKAGLTPITDAPGVAGYLQAVPLIEFRNNVSANSLTLSANGVVRRFTTPDLAGGYREDVDIKATLAFAGYGITAPNVG